MANCAQMAHPCIAVSKNGDHGTMIQKMARITLHNNDKAKKKNW